MKKSDFQIILAGLVFPLSAFAQVPPVGKDAPKPVSKPTATAQKPSRATMDSVLGKRIDNLEWDEMALENVIEWVQEQGPINVVVRWRSLETEGITADTPVSLRLRNATVGQILTEALEGISGTDSGVRFRGIGNTLQISTRADFNSKLYTRTYDAADLLFRVPNFNDGPQIQLTEQGGGGGGGGNGIGATTGPIFEEGDEEEDDEDSDELDRERMDELVEMIINTIEPESWREGGGTGTIVGFKRTIVVRNNIEVHEKLGGPFVFD